MTIEELRREIRTALRQDVARARRLVRRFARAAERQDDAALRAEALLMRAEVEDMAQRPKRALHKYRAAERAFSRCGSARQQAAVQIGIVQVCAELGDPKTVRRAAQKLRSLDLESRARAGSAIAIATAYETLGDARSAEAGYRDALRDLGRGRHPTVRFLRGTAAQNLAVCLGRRGAVREARRALARADRDFADLDVAHAHAIVRFTRGWLAGLAGDVALAQEELAAAHTAFLDAGDPKMSGLARLDLAALALGLGDTETAIEHAKQAERALRGRDFRVDAARARLQQARALARAGSAGRARTHARRAAETFDAAGDRAGAAHARVVAGEASGRTERTLREHGHFLGGLEALIAHARSSPPRRGATLLRERARGYPPVLRRWVQPELWGLRARGEPERAIPHLRRAVRAVEGLRRLAPVARLRATALASHLEWYDALAQALLARGRAADRREAFAVLDAARARTLHDEMERDAPGLGQTPRVRTLRRRLEQLWRAIEREERGSGDLRTSMPSLFDDVAAAERELLEAIEREVGAAALDARAPIPKHACLTLAILGGDVVALHAARERVTTWSAGRVVDWLEDLDTFSFQVARRLHGAEDHDNADALLVRMAGRLFAGAPDAWIEDTLHVVLPPMLGSLPVGALPYRDRPLMDQTTLAYAPRVGSRRARWSRDDAPLIVGSASDALPEVRREVRALKRRFPRGDLLSGGAADPDAVLRAMSGRGLVHLAGHARARDDAPSLSALRVGAGWLAAADLDGVPLTRSLVVLSACRTGDPGLRWHGEALAGFPRALLAAGASRVVASRWEVADAVARRFMDWFYKALETETPAGAVRAACLKVRSRFAHPADWAAFLCVEPGLL